MPLELATGAPAAPPDSPPVAAAGDAPRKRGRPPLDETQRAAKAQKEVARRLLKKLKGAKSEEELYAKLGAVKGGGAVPPPPVEVLPPEKTAETTPAPAETPAEILARKRGELEAARTALAELIGSTRGVVEGTRFAMDDVNANRIVHCAGPWFADQGAHIAELSPRMKTALMVAGVGLWLGPPVASLLKEYVPKVATWWRARKLEQAAAAQ